MKRKKTKASAARRVLDKNRIPRISDYNKGYKAGFAQSFNDGFKAGYSQGVEQGNQINSAEP